MATCIHLFMPLIHTFKVLKKIKKGALRSLDVSRNRSRSTSVIGQDTLSVCIAFELNDFDSI